MSRPKAIPSKPSAPVKKKAATSKTSHSSGIRFERATLIFADGASSGNPGPSGWGAIIASPDGHIHELGGGEALSTNNRMELLGTIRALRWLLQSGKRPESVHVFTDSSYVILGITRWIWGWRKRGWKTAEGSEVSHADLWQALAGIVQQLHQGRGDNGEKALHWHYVAGHAGIPGNERVDAIAVSFSKHLPISLYDGPLLSYPYAIHDIPEDTSVPEPKIANSRESRELREKKKSETRYLSMVNGKVEAHLTWAECERNVKGRSGAKFKKYENSIQGEAILKDWGIPTDRWSQLIDPKKT